MLQSNNDQLFDDQRVTIEKPLTMDGASDEEILHFVDDASLFEFNEVMHTQTDPDVYDAAPMPKDWDMGLTPQPAAPTPLPEPISASQAPPYNTKMATKSQAQHQTPDSSAPKVPSFA